ncbi:hypothetical protein [Actinoplanes sp. TFC3]|uniref:hypothetical protein n=1 Tax=Actinoplanes sp. TFC3 TaxID=1710355 RepID=UPI0008308246|nr:hypothetical protein [Actinoplanes sp. TFC3]
MRQEFNNLTYNEWYGLGPLGLAGVAGFRAFMADDSFARWAWGGLAVLMAIVSVGFVVWVRSSRRQVDGDGVAEDA